MITSRLILTILLGVGILALMTPQIYAASPPSEGAFVTPDALATDPACATVAPSYNPALAGQTACKLNSNPDPQAPACLEAQFKPGLPNTFGNAAAPPAAGFPPFKFRQQLTDQPLYIIVSDKSGVARYKMRYFLEVDRYSVMTLKGSAGNPDFDIAVAAGTALTPGQIADMEGVLLSAEFAGWSVPPVRRTLVRVPTNPSEDTTNAHRFVPAYYTLIIELDRGKMKGFRWERTCAGCSSDLCWKEEEQCLVQYSTCSTVQPTSDLDCDIRIYVGWAGTDVDGNYLMSSQKSIKNFLQFDLSTPFEDVTRTFTTLKPGGSDDGYY